MKPFETILFGADFSESSRQAFRAVCSLAVPGETRLHILHVIEPNWVPEEPVPYGQAAVGYYDASADEGREEALRRRMRETYTPNVPIDVEYHVGEGEAAAEILRVAGRLRPDLIALGTHGRTGLSWLLAGSVATSVLRRATCPVLAFHCPDSPRKIGDVRVILHPTDLSEGCMSSLRVARLLARDLGARLVLFHVAPHTVMVNEMSVPIDPHVYRQALEEERQLLDGPDLKYPVEIRLGRGDPADEILHTATELDCGLIVMGTHGRGGLSRLLMGSVAEHVVPRADCPVLVVKNPRRVEASAPAGAPEPVAAAH